MKSNSSEVEKADQEFLDEANISWLTRTLLRFSFKRGISRLARELSRPILETSKQAHLLFQHIESVDIIPSHSNLRGFHIVLDGLLALYFSQDGDHFVYDGFEIGTYDENEADVTVFDRLWEERGG